MKTTLTPVTVMKLTVKTVAYTTSKRVAKAEQAADFFSLVKTGEWWSQIGCKNITPQRNENYWKFHDKIYRRSLKVFQKYLP